MYALGDKRNPSSSETGSVEDALDFRYKISQRTSGIVHRHNIGKIDNGLLSINQIAVVWLPATFRRGDNAWSIESS